MTAETFSLKQALADILDASPGPAREFVYGYHWKRLAASEGHKKRLPQYRPPQETSSATMVQRLLSDGLTVTEISRALGISKGGVCNLIARHNLKRRIKFFRNAVSRDELLRLVQNGLTDAHIGEKYGFSASAVRRAREHYGIDHDA